MAASFYFDVHVDKAIHDQLRRRGVDVLRAQDDDAGELTDEELLERATKLGRIVVTHDVNFKVLAEERQRQGKRFSGLLHGRQLDVVIGKYVKDLELIAKASEPEDWENIVEHLPFV
ncbi:MAG: DUF5615 family PIN-like protein [Planctomycetes bacterium]|nr:DUF5615 family PIN-like protein [Planctomycetota bacterium]